MIVMLIVLLENRNFRPKVRVQLGLAYKYFVLPYHKTLPYVQMLPSYESTFESTRVRKYIRKYYNEYFYTCTKIHELYEGKSIYLLYLRNKVHVL